MVNATTVTLVNLFLIVFVGIISFYLFRASGNCRERRRFPGWKGRVSTGWYSQNRFFGVFFLILGCKLYWIHNYVSNIPFWDQWDAEGLRLYLPFLQDRLNWGVFFDHHNEHRIFWSRFWALGQFAMNGQWDIQWQTVSNAVWHSLVGALFCEATIRFAKNRGEVLWIPVYLILFCTPFTCQNFLFGFQSAFYFFQFFAGASLVLLFGTRPLSVSWHLGWVCLIFSFLSLAGGVLVAGVIAIGSGMRLLLLEKKERGWVDVCWPLFAVLLFLVGFWLTPDIPHHQKMRATGIMHLITNFIHLSAWPFSRPNYSLIQAAGFSLLLWTPWFLCVLTGFFSRSFRTRLSSRYWILLVLGGWVLASALASAYSRGNAPTFGYTGRYADLFGMGFLTAVVSAVIFGSVRWANPLGRLLGILCLASIVTWSIGFYHFNQFYLKVMLPYLQENGEVQIENINGYVQSGDMSYLLNKEKLELPLSNPQSLATFLSMSEYRAILPWTIREPIGLVQESTSSGPFLENGVPAFTQTRPGEMVWGSYAPELGERYIAESQFVLNRDPNYPFLVIYLAGYPRAEGIQVVARADGIPVQDIWRTNPGPLWLERRFAAGKGNLQIQAQDQSPESWVAFSEPRELGWFSFFAIVVSKRFDIFLSIGLALMGICFITKPIFYKIALPVHPLRGFSRLAYSLRALCIAWKTWEAGDKPSGLKD